MIKTGMEVLFQDPAYDTRRLDPGLPESFNVLIKEMQSLALNVDLLEEPE